MPHNAQLVRGVAQPGSALAWGARGREFESRRPDHEIPGKGDVPIRFVSFFYFSVPAENYFGERMHSDGNDTEEDRQIHRHCEKELVSLDRDVGHFAHQKKGKIAPNPNLNGQHDQYRPNSVLAENDYPPPGPRVFRDVSHLSRTSRACSPTRTAAARKNHMESDTWIVR